MRHLVKVPVAAILATALVSGCGGDAESAADLESERLEALIEAEVEARLEERIDSIERREVAEAPREAAPPQAQGPARTPPPAQTPPRTETPPPVQEAEPPVEVAAPPEAAPEEAQPITLPAGSRLQTVVETDISTRTHEVGSPFRTRVSDDVVAPDGLVLVPRGSYLEGRVVEARRSTSSDEYAVLELAFEHLVMEGVRVPIQATLADAELESEAGDSGARTAAKVATGAAAGAVIGRILGRDTRSTVQGAAAGAVAGVGVALTTRDGHAIIREGSTIVVQLDRPVVVASGG